MNGNLLRIGELSRRSGDADRLGALVLGSDVAAEADRLTALVAAPARP